jgi:hypothetical protein
VIDVRRESAPRGASARRSRRRRAAPTRSTIRVRILQEQRIRSARSTPPGWAGFDLLAA